MPALVTEKAAISTTLSFLTGSEDCRLFDIHLYAGFVVNELSIIWTLHKC